MTVTQTDINQHESAKHGMFRSLYVSLRIRFESVLSFILVVSRILQSVGKIVMTKMQTG